MAYSTGNNTSFRISLSLVSHLKNENLWDRVEYEINPFCQIAAIDEASIKKLREVADCIDGDHCEGLTLVHRVVSDLRVPGLYFPLFFKMWLSSVVKMK